MYSVKYAALVMGVSKRHLRLLLHTVQVKGNKLGRDWVVLSLDYDRKRKPKRSFVRPNACVARGTIEPANQGETFVLEFVRGGAVQVTDLIERLKESWHHWQGAHEDD